MEVAKIQKILGKLSSDKIAIAVSGGSDSMALALLVSELFGDGKTVLSLTVDHGLRPESSSEAIQVGKWLKKYNIEHHILKWEGEKPSSNIQAEARDARYELMSRFCQNHKIIELLVGHTRDDQAETVLMHIMRGSGIDGLSGMSSESNIYGVNIIRPLLNGFTREELQYYLKSKGQEWIEDPSNNNNRFSRVKVREIIDTTDDPVLLKNRLVQTAAHMYRAQSYINYMMQERLKDIVTFYEEGFCSVIIDKFINLHEEERLRFLAGALKKIGGNKYRPRFEKLQNLHDKIIENKLEGGCTIAGCVVFASSKKSERNLLFIFREQSAIEGNISISKNEKFVWDGRYECSTNINSDDLTVGALGSEGLRFLEKEGVVINRRKYYFVIPRKILYTLPTLRFAGRIFFCALYKLLY